MAARQLEHAITKVIREWLGDLIARDADLLDRDASVVERECLITASRDLIANLDAAALRNLIERVDLNRSAIRVTLDRDALYEALCIAPAADSLADAVTIQAPITLKRRGVKAKLIIGDDPAGALPPDIKLIAAIGQAKQWTAELQAGAVHSVRELAARENLDRSHVSGILPLAFLAPDIVTAIIEGRHAPDLTLTRLKRIKLPASWQVQRNLLGIE